MEIKILIPSFFLLVLVSGQSFHKSYDWRTTGEVQEWPQRTSLLPYKRQAATEAYPVVADPGPYHDNSGPYHDNPGPYHSDSGPYDDDSQSYQDDSYSAEYHRPLPYKYPAHGDVDQSISSYEQYNRAPPHEEELNMTVARIGGFAGSGDTRGFGAYDFPKTNHHQEVRSHPSPKLQTELTDLLRIGRNHHTGYHNPDPLLIHPIPPPL